MFSKLFRAPVLMAFGPTITPGGYDVPKGFQIPQYDNKESGWDRIVKMYITDEYGRMSNELNSIYQAIFLGAFLGAVYGGFLGSRKSYIDFMERNQATAFENHLDAKRKLQNQVTIGFARNAYRFGWRLALFTGSYTAITTSISVYRGKSSIIEYATAGAVTGSFYKVNLGLRGMFAGGLVGGVLGTVAGGVSLLVLRSSGMTMEEVRYWQYKWRSQRDDAIADNFASAIKGTEHDNVLMKSHDSRVGLDKLDIKSLLAEERAAVAAEVAEKQAQEAVKPPEVAKMEKEAAKK